MIREIEISSLLILWIVLCSKYYMTHLFSQRNAPKKMSVSFFLVLCNLFLIFTPCGFYVSIQPGFLNALSPLFKKTRSGLIRTISITLSLLLLLLLLQLLLLLSLLLSLLKLLLPPMPFTLFHFILFSIDYDYYYYDYYYYCLHV